MSAPRPAIDRFTEKWTEDERGCWVWIAALDACGYGQFLAASARTGGVGSVRAHRWAYEHYVGPIPEGLQLDHLCRNRACVNPWHLEPVTPQENIRRSDAPAALNSRKTHCGQGHALTGENLAPWDARRGKRSCRICNRERSAQRRVSA